MKKIVYIPLDERPCNYSFTGFISENNPKYNLVRPSLDMMGDKKKPADYNKIRDFLIKECRDADHLIIAVDTLLYGGIVPSRLHHLTQEELTQRLGVLHTIKKENPRITIYGFGLVMRCPCYTDSDEEPDYYGICGLEIFEYGQNEHKYRDGLISREEYELERERLKVCEPYLDDFLTRREVNISLFLDVLRLVGSVIDEFVILQDDSNPCGYTAMDQAKVRALINEMGINVDIYPGADEGGLTLLARSVCKIIEGASPKIFPVYPKEECMRVIPTYEDREFYKSLAAQIRSAGATLVEREEEADILLFCNLPAGEMKNVMYPGGEQYDARELDKFVHRMKKAVECGRGVAVADVGYINGGDIELTEMIMKEIGLLKLWGYAGWNTSSNTLGTVICQAILRYFYGDSETHRTFTALRIFEDIGYCAKVRKHVWDNEVEKMGYRYEDTKVREGEVSERIGELIREFISDRYPEIAEKYEIKHIYMPWRRMFEVGLEIVPRI